VSGGLRRTRRASICTLPVAGIMSKCGCEKVLSFSSMFGRVIEDLYKLGAGIRASLSSWKDLENEE